MAATPAMVSAVMLLGGALSFAERRRASRLHTYAAKTTTETASTIHPAIGDICLLTMPQTTLVEGIETPPPTADLSMSVMKMKKALPSEQTRQRHDEGRDAQARHERPLDGADERARAKPHDHGSPPGPVVGIRHELTHDHGADEADVGDGEVDLTQQQRERLGHAEHDVDRREREEVDDVARLQVLRCFDLEDDRDQEQRGDDRKQAALAISNSASQRSEVLAKRSDDLGRDGKVGRRDHFLWMPAVRLTG